MLLSELHTLLSEIQRHGAFGNREKRSVLTIERILWTSADSATPPPATMRRRIAETNSHSWRKYLRRTTSLESCSSSPTAVGSAEASASAEDPVGSDGAGVAALDAQAVAAAPVSSIAGARGGCPRATGGVRGCATVPVRPSVFCSRSQFPCLQSEGVFRYSP